MLKKILLAFAFCLVCTCSALAQDYYSVWGGDIVIYNYDYNTYVKTKGKIMDTGYVTLMRVSDKQTFVTTKQTFYQTFHFRDTQNGPELMCVINDINAPPLQWPWKTNYFWDAQDNIRIHFFKKNINKVFYVEVFLQHKDKSVSEEGQQNVATESLNLSLYGHLVAAPLQGQNYVYGRFSQKSFRGFSIYTYEVPIKSLDCLTEPAPKQISAAQMSVTLSSQSRSMVFLLFRIYRLLIGQNP